MKKEDERKMHTIKLKMLRMICGKTLRNGISNQAIRDLTRVGTHMRNTR